MNKTNILIQVTKVELNWLKDYVKFLDDSVEDELRAIKKAADTTTDERYIEKLIDDHHMVGFHFSKHTMFTSYTLVHSFLERALSNVVGKISEDRPTLLKPSDLSGEDSIRKNKNYLSKVVGLDLSVGTWSKLHPYIEVRNLLVHSLGKMNEDTPSKRRGIIEQFAKSNEHLDIDDDSVLFGREFVYEFIVLVKELFDELNIALHKWSKVRGI